MIEGIKEIGEYLLAKSNKSLLDIEIEELNPKGKYSKVVKIVFDYAIEDYKRENIRKYLYARKGSQGANYSPTAIV
jgi:CRISPR-associated protein Csh1